MPRAQYTDLILTKQGVPAPYEEVGIKVHEGSEGSETFYTSETGPATVSVVKSGPHGVVSVWLEEGRYDISVPNHEISKTVDVINQESVGSGTVGPESITTEKLAGEGVTEAKLSSAVRTKLNETQKRIPLAARVVAVEVVESLAGLLTIDGVTVTAGDVVLLTSQADRTQNRLWVVGAGAWTASPEFSGEVPNGAIVAIYDGETNQGSVFVCTTLTKPIVAGTTELTWENNATGGTQAAEKTEIVKPNFKAYTKLQEWPSNAIPFREDMWRWRADEATEHAASTNIVAALKEGANSEITKSKVTEYGPENFNPTLVLGLSSDTEKEYNDSFTYWPSVHKNASAPASNESSDKGVTTIDSVTGRGVTTGGSTVSGHDLVKGPGYSSNSKEGGAIPLSGEALLTEPEKEVKTSCKRTESSTTLTNIASTSEMFEGMTISGTGIEAGTKVSEVKSATEIKMSAAATASGTSELTFKGKPATKETGGPSSSRIEVNTLFTIRARNLVDSDTNWRTAINHPLRMTIRGPAAKAGAPAGAGMAPRTTTKYGESIVTEPLDNRLPYIWPAHQGEVTGNASSNVYAPPNGCWFRLAYTEAEIAALSCPNFTKAVLYALSRWGTFAVDVQGAEGVELCRFEGLFSYKWLSDTYYTSWLKAKTDGIWLVEEKEPFPHEAFKRWKFDLTGNGALPAATLFSKLRVLKPPPKPTDLAS